MLIVHERDLRAVKKDTNQLSVSFINIRRDPFVSFEWDGVRFDIHRANANRATRLVFVQHNAVCRNKETITNILSSEIASDGNDDIITEKGQAAERERGKHSLYSQKSSH